jgi:hypothetical protein
MVPQNFPAPSASDHAVAAPQPSSEPAPAKGDVLFEIVEDDDEEVIELD